MLARYLLGLSLLCTVCAGIFAGCSSTEEPAAPISVEGQQFVARGLEIVTGLAACGTCHSLNGLPGEPLSGGRTLVDLYGDISGSNITLAQSGLGGWSERDVLTLLRLGKRPDGTSISPEVHRGYEWLSDLDVAAVVGYLRSVPPVDRTIERREISLVDRNTTGFFAANKEVTGYVPSISPSFKVEYGQYLADHVARCGSCHNTPPGLMTSEKYWGGGKTIVFNGEELIAPEITNSKVSGLGDWSEEDVKTYLRTGRTPDNRRVNSTFCPTDFYQRATNEDITALVAYIRTVQPEE